MTDTVRPELNQAADEFRTAVERANACMKELREAEEAVYQAQNRLHAANEIAYVKRKALFEVASGGSVST